MRQQIGLIVAALAVLSAACGGAAESTGKNSNTNANAARPVVSPSVPPEVNDVNAAAPVAQGNSNARRKPVDAPAAGPAPPLRFNPSSDNSETAITMNKDGLFVEVRVFRDHPQFERIEATWIGLPLKELKFTLRNGKVVTARTEKLTNLQNATAAELAEIAGQAAQ